MSYRSDKSAALAYCAAALVAALAAPAVSAQEIYGRGGFPGYGIGYAHALGASATVRAEATTLGRRNLSGERQGVDFDGAIKAEQRGVYGDWFPGDNGFRLTGGVSSNNIRFTGDARPSDGTITINRTTVPFGPTDAYRVEVKYSPLSPYAGIGWGHHPSSSGWGFVADLGVHFGRLNATGAVSPSLFAKLMAAGVDAQAEVDEQTRRVQDELDRFRVLPVVSVGVSYRW